jgi:hypothetical protein
VANVPKFTHLVNPFRAQAGSEHDIAQRVTFASIRTAVDYAKARGTDVDVVATCYEEDVPSVEPPARMLPLLQRSIQDLAKLKPLRKFPLMGDLLKVAAENSNGEYLIYTNIDITLQPYFYHHVAWLLKWIGRYSNAFVINRRTVSKASDPSELPKLYAEYGQGHLGYDCFVFPRAWVPDMDLGLLCIGTHLFDSTLFAMMDLRSGFKTRCFARQQLTLHLGDDGYMERKPEYMAYNQKEATRLMAAAREKYGKPIPWWAEFTRRELLIEQEIHAGPPLPLGRRLVWRAIEQMSLRQTRSLLNAYLKGIDRPDLVN